MARSVLVPLDGSEESEVTLGPAAHLARTHGLDLVLLRVAPYPTALIADRSGGYGMPIMDETLLTAERDAAVAYLEEVRDRLAAEGIVAQTIVREGNVEEHILDISDELGVQMIALATHGRGGFLRFALGSLTDRMLQASQVPLLLVRIQDEAPARHPAYKKVLIPVDGSPLAEAGLDIALEVAEPGAELILLSIQRRRTMTIPMGMTAVTVPDVEGTQAAIDETKTYLDELAARVEATFGHVQTIVRRGDPAQQILETARDHDVDLIVLSTHGHTGASRWLRGSVADDVVRHSQRPVLLASARSFATRAAGDFTVGDVMTTDVVTVTAQQSLGSAVRRLLRRGLSGAPVVDADGQLVGVLTENDILAWQAHLSEAPVDELPVSRADYTHLLEQTTVGEVMTKPAPAIEESAVLSSAIAMFRELRVRPLPVTSAGTLVGVIRRADVLRSMMSGWQTAAQRLEQQEAQVPQTQ